MSFRENLYNDVDDDDDDLFGSLRKSKTDLLETSNSMGSSLKTPSTLETLEDILGDSDVLYQFILF